VSLVKTTYPDYFGICTLSRNMTTFRQSENVIVLWGKERSNIIWRYEGRGSLLKPSKSKFSQTVIWGRGL